MRVKRRSDSSFTIDQENWIFSQFHQGFSLTQVRRNFSKKYGFSTKVRKLKANHFSAVFIMFCFVENIQLFFKIRSFWWKYIKFIRGSYVVPTCASYLLPTCFLPASYVLQPASFLFPACFQRACYLLPP